MIHQLEHVIFSHCLANRYLDKCDNTVCPGGSVPSQSLGASGAMLICLAQWELTFCLAETARAELTLAAQLQNGVGVYPKGTVVSQRATPFDLLGEALRPACKSPATPLTFLSSLHRGTQFMKRSCQR